ncbi:SET domain-containing protein-lysine N-methyltransferase [Funiculus sociatus GB2-A5]|uniref:SET domain-containing protein-lysine N-methyltransferase n=1 Tax=Funiculus sociatus GB2-A5 TaxID=2933946 RepID=A0ABV0JN75_9CYAN|nr:SET domain-containing protein-lysine N-methyltransferase [Trichocoleus sp. FACHB-6]MBD2063952.1 SET domain-containing protein-lysine N-methyltransferase [Trichocoleus sp. FACHB-6]
MKVCVLQPDYSQATVNFDSYTSPSYFPNLKPEDEVNSVFLNKATIYRQLKELKKEGYDIFVNLCRGYRHWDVPSCHEVMSALEALKLPYTGSAATLYDSPKQEMKHIAYFAGVDTPAFWVAETLTDVENASVELNFPLFVKPAASGDGLGIDARSHITTKEALLSKATELIADFDTILIEEYIAGREFTVLLVANPDDACSPIVYQPIEFVPPKDEHFQSYDLKLRQSHPECYVPCDDPQLELSLRDAARRLFLEMNQGGYASIDLRVDENGEIFFLEVNSPCAVFGTQGHETVADYILKFEPAGHAGFFNQIIAEGITGHQRRQKKYRVGKSAIATYGIFATQDFKTGDAIVPGEARTQRIVTRSHVQSRWTEAEQGSLLRYIYPLGEDILVLRDSNPGNWILQNHSCDPNTGYQGLDLIALRDIKAGEELTVDFAAFCGEDMEGFQCMCGSPKCRGDIQFASCCKPRKNSTYSLNLMQTEMLAQRVLEASTQP